MTDALNILILEDNPSDVELIKVELKTKKELIGEEQTTIYRH